jgi:hypothetical protein
VRNLPETIFGPPVKPVTFSANSFRRAAFSTVMELGGQVHARAAGLASRIRALSPRARFLCAVWGVFAILVAAGVHGSSIGETAVAWAPERPYTGALLRNLPIPTFIKKRFSKDQIRKALLEVSPIVRSDEYFGGTPFALSQLTHSPRFPVVNTNIGADGQNMLVTQHAPVLHLVTLGRPATWGYFFLGARRGLTWSWWFQPFACFTGLMLLLEVVLRGHWKLAAFGAFLFCSSAYIVCWSQWPTYVTMFAAVACLSGYHLLASRRRGVLIASAILLGVAIAGFVTDLYPPWQVPIGQVFGGLFIALVARDRLLGGLAEPRRLRIGLAAAAVVIAGVMVFAWWRTCAADLRVMAHTNYPGQRVSTGGDLTFALLFRGTYNLFSIYERYKPLKNECEASSFYYFFPAVFALLCFSREVRRRFGAVGWFLTGYIVVLLMFLLVGLPAALAKALFLSYTQARSADIALGVASIILTIHTLVVVREVRASGDAIIRGRTRFVAPAVAAVVLAIFLIHAHMHHTLVGKVPTLTAAIAISAVMAGLSWAIAAGRTLMFVAPLALLQAATSFWFNPLATNLDDVYHSELANAIRSTKESTGAWSTWAVFGGTDIGTLIEMLGDRALTGPQWPPQLHAWSMLDPDGKQFAVYNRYGEVSFRVSRDPESISFENPTQGILVVKLSPDNSRLKQLGVRFVLLVGDQQVPVEESKLRLVYRSRSGHFTIRELL